MTIARFVVTLMPIGGGIGAAACTSKATPGSNDSSAGSLAGTDSATSGDARSMPGMTGWPGMSGTQRMMGIAALDSMRTRVQAMGRMSPDQVGTMLPDYRAAMENMLSRMTSYMRTATVPASAAWTALTDSVRQDLARLPRMSKPQLAEAMPAHQARVARLMQMQRDMLGRR